MNVRSVLAGITLMMIGMSMLSLSSHTDFAGLILIGPLPIVIASNMSMAVYVLLIAAMLILLLFIFR